MFQRLGTVVVRLWPVLLIGWIVALTAVQWTAPPWEEVVRDGEFDFLPHDSPSLRGEQLAKRAFPDDVLASSVVIVARRPRSPEGLLQFDKDFIDQELKAAIEDIAKKNGGLAETSFSEEADGDEDAADYGAKPTSHQRSIISRVRTLKDGSIGHLLISKDKQATLVIVELTTEFLDARNKDTIDAIEDLINTNQEFRKKIPAGLDLATSGAATVGRDMIDAGTESSKSTEFWTFVLVIALLVGIYRAPFLAIIPLVTVFVATKFTMALLALLSESDLVGFFRDLEIYVTILSYGAGVDYCLFLIARYKEELERGDSINDALSNSLGKVGAALTASAGTVICGIGMMIFAEFGKFRQAGVGISLGLVIVLLATLTFTPTLLRLVGPIAFWPRVPNRRIAATAGWISSANLFSRVMELDVFRTFWRRVGQTILHRPGLVWLTSIAVMTPFAVIGVAYYSYLSYGLLTELPRDRPSVLGAKAIQSHFPAGVAGPVTFLVKNPKLDFIEYRTIIEDLTLRLQRDMEEANIADIRSVSHPYGVEFEYDKLPLFEQLSVRKLTQPYYVSSIDDSGESVARIDVIFREDPFSRYSIRHLDELKRRINSEYLAYLFGVVFEPSEPVIKSVVEDSPATVAGLQPGDRIVGIGEANSNFPAINDFDQLHDSLADLAKGDTATVRVVANSGDQPKDVTIQFGLNVKDALRTEILAIGPTASIADLKGVTDRDQIRIDVLVLSGVFLILVVLLRRPAISMYLIVSVFFSYLATLGVTFALFYFLDTAEFAGLDWKVPMFLFTILIAVGEDYNIFLMTRIDEEQEQHGAVDGVIVALERTGGIISSCGMIMAGTFCSLLFGTIIGMHQLGFALAFGVLLDTFVVRPILVPAYLVMLYQGRFGRLGRFLGANRVEAIKSGHSTQDDIPESPSADLDASIGTIESDSASTDSDDNNQLDSDEQASVPPVSIPTDE